jgi:hypothetical protein
MLGLGLKEKVRRKVSFLAEFGYQETNNPQYIIKGWEHGIVFSNGIRVVMFLIDKKEGLLTTVIYVIQSDYILPKVNSEEFIVLDNYLNEEWGRYSSFKIFGMDAVLENIENVLRNQSDKLLYR